MTSYKKLKDKYERLERSNRIYLSALIVIADMTKEKLHKAPEYATWAIKEASINEISSFLTDEAMRIINNEKK